MTLPDGTLITVYQPNSVGYYDLTTVDVADLSSVPSGSFIYAYAANGVGSFDFQRVLVSDIGDLPEGSEAWVREPNGVGWYDAVLVGTTELVSGYVGPLDIVPGAIVAFGQRALSAAMRGSTVYTIRENSGNTTQPFSSDATTGAVSVSVIMAFLDGAAGFVAVWNDQSGNEKNAAQASAAHQPGWDSNAFTVPGLTFLRASEQFLATASISLPTGAYTAFFVYQINGIVDTPLSYGLFGINGQQDPDGLVFSTAIGVSTDTGAVDALATSDDYNSAYVEITSNPAAEVANAPALLDYTFTHGAADIKINGTTLTFNFVADSGAVGAISGALGIGSSDANPSFEFPDLLTGNIAEIILYNSTLNDSDRLAIRQNIADYYGILL